MIFIIVRCRAYKREIFSNSFNNRCSIILYRIILSHRILYNIRLIYIVVINTRCYATWNLTVKVSHYLFVQTFCGFPFFYSIFGRRISVSFRRKPWSREFHDAKRLTRSMSLVFSACRVSRCERIECFRCRQVVRQTVSCDAGIHHV